jgi:hypothetical protein
MRQLFSPVSQAIDRVIPLLTSAPHAEVIHGPLACMLSLNDMCDRTPVAADDTPLDIGGHRLRFIATPHVPHNWEGGLWFDETTSTLLAGDDLLTHVGKQLPLTESDLVGKALAAEGLFHATGLTNRADPDAASARRPAADDAGADAWRVVHRRQRSAVARAGRRLRTTCGTVAGEAANRPAEAGRAGEGAHDDFSAQANGRIDRRHCSIGGMRAAVKQLRGLARLTVNGPLRQKCGVHHTRLLSANATPHSW